MDTPCQGQGGGMKIQSQPVIDAVGGGVACGDTPRANVRTGVWLVLILRRRSLQTIG